MRHEGQDRPPDHTVGDRVSAGAGVIVGGNMIERVLGILSIAALGRLLTPADFGVIAMALVVIALTEALENGQFRWALIRIPRPEPADYDTAFTLQSLLGLLLGAAVFLSAGPVARLAETPEVEAVLRWMALSPAIANLRNPYFINFSRELRFVQPAAVSIAARVAATTTAIAVAVIRGDYWALVAGAVVLVSVRTALSYLIVPQRPRLGLSRWRAFMGFGAWLSATGIVETGNRRIDTALVSLRLDVVSTGLYHMSKEIANMAVRQFAGQFRDAIYPGMALVSADRARLHGAYYKTMGVMLGVLLPLGAGVALVAPEAIRVLVGEQWAASAVLVQWLAPVGALAALAATVQTRIMLSGDTRVLFLRGLAILALQAPLLWFAIASMGLMGAVYAGVAVALIDLLIFLGLSRRMTGDGFFKPLLVAWRSILAMAAMVAAVLALDAALGPLGDSVLAAALHLAAKAACGGAVYAVVHLALWQASGRPDGLERAALDMAARTLGRLRGSRRRHDHAG